MITAHTFCALPEGHSLWRWFALVAERRHDGRWVVRQGNTGYLDGIGDLTPDPVTFDEDTAVRLAEEMAPKVRAWTEKGILTAAEADAAGLR